MNLKYASFLFFFLTVSLILRAEEPEKPAVAPPYYEITYAPSTDPKECQIGVTYTLWVPPGVKTIRGVIVHQHGCGEGACKGGQTAAYDLHWQALAKKWDCALLGPSFHQSEKQDCGLWCNPKNGSDKFFLHALSEFSTQTKHPELEKVPWCLWGHSGGAAWVGHMQLLYPERTIATWYRSGSPFPSMKKAASQPKKEGEPEKPADPWPFITPLGLQVPMICNCGIKEKDDKRFHVAWDGATEMFSFYRMKGAPIAVAVNPRTSHQCGDSRYLAILFFDACLELRLPDPNAPATDAQTLRMVELGNGWLAPYLGNQAWPIGEYAGGAVNAMWLPNEKVAKAWVEYTNTGEVSDKTPPPAPTDLKLVKNDTGVELSWNAEADLESGLQAFVIQRDGKDLAQVPEKPAGTFGRPLFQKMGYHDTPEQPLPQMRYIDSSAKPGEEHEYSVISINAVGLRSEPSAKAK